MRCTFRLAWASLPALRTIIIRGLPCMIGVAAGSLTYLACHSVPQALLASGSAVGGSAQLLGQMLDASPRQPANNRIENHGDNINQKKP